MEWDEEEDWEDISDISSPVLSTASSPGGLQFLALTRGQRPEFHQGLSQRDNEEEVLVGRPLLVDIAEPFRSWDYQLKDRSFPAHESSAHDLLQLAELWQGSYPSLTADRPLHRTSQSNNQTEDSHSRNTSIRGSPRTITSTKLETSVCSRSAVKKPKDSRGQDRRTDSAHRTRLKGIRSEAGPDVRQARPANSSVSTKVSNTSGSTRVSSSSGQVKVPNSSGPVKVLNSSGPVKVPNYSGSVKVPSSSVSGKFLNSSVSAKFLNSSVSAKVLNSSVSTRVSNSSVSAKVSNSSVSTKVTSSGSARLPNSICKNKISWDKNKSDTGEGGQSLGSLTPRTFLERVSDRKSGARLGIQDKTSGFGLGVQEKKRNQPSGKKTVPVRYSLLQEYHRSRHHQQEQDQLHYLQRHYQSLGKIPYSHLLELEEEERVKTVIFLVCCVMGIGVVVALVVLLSQYVEGQELEQGKQAADDENFTGLMNQVYYRRLADLIRTTKIADEMLQIGETPLTPPNKLCSGLPSNLVGNNTDIILNMTVEIEDIIYNNSDVAEGGEWRPSNCAPRYRVAIIVPYRDRWAHLKILLHYLIPTLKRQLIHFRIFVVEQFGNETFNKGRIMNAAFREALKLFDFHCVTFHDVDLVPEDDRNMYTCTEQPKHMSHGIDKFKYILPYQGLVGGVLMFKREHFQLVNGYSNMYWGWGAEDDDMTTRILYRGLRIYRPPSTIAKYKMVKHHGRKSSEVAVRMRLLRSAAKRSRLEGLNNVNYTLVSLHIAKLFTHFIVDIGRQTD